jgi:hypothetical protein
LAHAVTVLGWTPNRAATSLEVIKGATSVIGQGWAIPCQSTKSDSTAEGRRSIPCPGRRRRRANRAARHCHEGQRAPAPWIAVAQARSPCGGARIGNTRGGWPWGRPRCQRGTARHRAARPCSAGPSCAQGRAAPRAWSMGDAEALRRRMPLDAHASIPCASLVPMGTLVPRATSIKVVHRY